LILSSNLRLCRSLFPVRDTYASERPATTISLQEWWNEIRLTPPFTVLVLLFANLATHFEQKWWDRHLACHFLLEMQNGTSSKLEIWLGNDAGLVRAVLEPPVIRAQSRVPRDAPAPRISRGAIETVPNACPINTVTSSPPSFFSIGECVPRITNWTIQGKKKAIQVGGLL
jgi:hypothetical protein